MTTATELSRATQLFHALSDETRLAVVEMLRDGERCVCDLQDALDVAQSRLSFHLKVLKDAGVVTDRKDGRWVHYALSSEAFEELAALATDLKPSRRALSIRGGKACCD
jgi:ArsR family transcriptional regulator